MTQVPQNPTKTSGLRSRFLRAILLSGVITACLVGAAMGDAVYCQLYFSASDPDSPIAATQVVKPQLLEGNVCFSDGACEQGVLVHGLLPADVGKALETRIAQAAGRPLWICFHSEGGARSAIPSKPFPSNVRTCVAEVETPDGKLHEPLCTSACAWLWMAGQQRELMGASTIGVHKAYLYDSPQCAPANHLKAWEGFVQGWWQDWREPLFSPEIREGRHQLRWLAMFKGPDEAFFVGWREAHALGLHPNLGRNGRFLVAAPVPQASTSGESLNNSESRAL